ncbi:centrosomal protein of 68 kDa [Corythoichthys intestinalis]|uniref:centrosomal protein of 68 kDa n=1 Tax=Corythoichthys intestinalis TaxID=161448 RepID=UPI0025A53E2B|nr:centrosomal protein of 68 kDa [Corythoichthys intestinalis]
MDTAQCTQPWKVHVPDTCHKHSIRLNADDFASYKREIKWEKEHPPKSVTMAPTSRYLVDRQYVMRKPLFSIEQPSILKKTQHCHQLKEIHVSVSSKNESQHPTNNSVTRLDKNPVSYNFTPSESASLQVCNSPLGSPDITSELQHEEKNFGPTSTRKKSLQYDLSSSVLDFQEKDCSVRPQLTSTVLYPSSTPCSFAYSKIGQQEVKKQNIYSSARQSRRRNMSYYEANYWDCVIPKSLPKSTNRQTAAWDPNQEYQALLDYTYPLRPGHVDSEWDSMGDSCRQQDLNTQDSGIELDNLCTTSPYWLHSNVSNTIETKAWDSMNPKSNSLDLNPSVLFSRTMSNELLLDHVDIIDNDVQYEQLSSVSFIRTTSLLSQSKYIDGDIDKEFWSLPDHLEEVQLLTRQVKEVTARLNQPVTAFCQHMDSILPTISHNEQAKDANAKEGQKYNGNTCTTTNERSAVEPDDNVKSEAIRRRSTPWQESVGGGLIDSSLKEVETLVEQLDGLHLINSQKLNLVDNQQNDSLTQHIHMFCSLLKQYISWLYEVSDKMDTFARPTPDNDNLKSSLAEYQRFQQEVRSQQHLTSRVLQTGELLLSCMDSASPLLGNTLLLIERQSKAMEKLTDHFLSSI